jgi:hypothetical protein
MTNTNFNSDALAELLKNAPTIKVDVKHAIVPSVQPTLPATPVVNVNPPPLLPANNLNINAPKKSNNTLWIIGLSAVGGYGIYRLLRWLDERKYKTNK